MKTIKDILDEFEKLPHGTIGEFDDVVISFDKTRNFLSSSLNELLDSILKEYINQFEVTDHLQCGNEKCFYDGKWCYHLTDKEFEEFINKINNHR